MKNLCLLFCFLLACGTLSAQVPSPSTPRLLFEDGSYLGKDNPMPVSGDIEIGSITLDALPSYQDSTGTATRALVDSEDRVLVNIGSDTIGLKSAVDLVRTEIESMAAESKGLEGFSDSTSTMFTVTGVTKLPTLTEGTKSIYLYASEDTLFGGEGISISYSVEGPYIPARAPFIRFSVSTSTPELYFRGRDSESPDPVIRIQEEY